MITDKNLKISDVHPLPIKHIISQNELQISEHVGLFYIYYYY